MAGEQNSSMKRGIVLVIAMVALLGMVLMVKNDAQAKPNNARESKLHFDTTASTANEDESPAVEPEVRTVVIERTIQVTPPVTSVTVHENENTNLSTDASGATDEYEIGEPATPEPQPTQEDKKKKTVEYYDELYLIDDDGWINPPEDPTDPIVPIIEPDDPEEPTDPEAPEPGDDGPTPTPQPNEDPDTGVTDEP